MQISDLKHRGLIALVSTAFLCSQAVCSLAEDHAEFFEKSVRPVLAEHCYECHAAEERSGGLWLDSREGWQAGGDSGDALVPGKPEASRLIEAIRYENLDLQMPPDGKLSARDVAALEKWVELGAPDPRRATNTGPTQNKPSTGMSIEEGREFWSFRPVANPQPPKVSHQAWVRNPIDAFVLARLEAEGLTPAKLADRRTMLRRVTFDLIGLPPTPAEVESFLADDSPDAFERVVERLLASPHYGERWGRHWLDVARYADSNGLDENLAFGNAWRYRDYVVQAFNTDKAYDEFVMEQIAGDLLPNADQEALTGTGFLALAPRCWRSPIAKN